MNFNYFVCSGGAKRGEALSVMNGTEGLVKITVFNRWVGKDESTEGRGRDINGLR